MVTIKSEFAISIRHCCLQTAYFHSHTRTSNNWHSITYVSRVLSPLFYGLISTFYKHGIYPFENMMKAGIKRSVHVMKAALFSRARQSLRRFATEDVPQTWIVTPLATVKIQRTSLQASMHHIKHRRSIISYCPAVFGLWTPPPVKTDRVVRIQ